MFLIGMDFFGFGSSGKHKNGKLNNMYAGMEHYVPAGPDEIAPTYRNWQRRFEWLVKHYPDTDFYHVNPLDGKSPERLRGYDNFHQVTFDNVVDMTTYHVGLQAHLAEFVRVKDEFVKEPYPAWTAIGVAELAVPGARVEVKVVGQAS